MANTFHPGDLAIVVPGVGGANNVRSAPVALPKCGNCIGSFPEHAVITILPPPADWAEAYPKDDGVFVWYCARGRTAARRPSGRYEVIEGWTAASKHGLDYLTPAGTGVACWDTMGTQFNTALAVGQQVYVLPANGLKIRRDAGGAPIGGLAEGTIVVITAGPECGNKMIWWQVRLANGARPIGWVSEGEGVEQLLAPLTLEY